MADLHAATAAGLAADLARLEHVWAQLGLSAADAAARRSEVVGHLARMVVDMAAEEERQRDDILRSIAENRARVAELERELEMPPSTAASSSAPSSRTSATFPHPHHASARPAHADTSLLRVDTELEERCEALEAERERRLEEKVELESRAELLRESLVLDEREAADLSLRHDISVSGLERLREIVGEYERQLEARRREAAPAVAACQGLMRDLCYVPEDDFEAQVAKGLEGLSLSASTLRALRGLHDRLEAQLARLGEDVALLYADVDALWHEVETPAAERKICLKALGGDPARLPATGAAIRLLRKEHSRLIEVRGGSRTRGERGCGEAGLESEQERAGKGMRERREGVKAGQEMQERGKGK